MTSLPRAALVGLELIQRGENGHSVLRSERGSRSAEFKGRRRPRITNSGTRPWATPRSLRSTECPFSPRWMSSRPTSAVLGREVTLILTR